MSRARSMVVAASLPLLVWAAPATAEADRPADVCLDIAGGLHDDERAAVVEAVAAVVAEDRTLFPGPTVTATGTRIDIHAGHPDLQAVAGVACLMDEFDWTARFSREFLVEGAELMLEEADKTPGFDSSIELEWFPGEARLRSTLSFSGPFGIPSGTCWVDDVLSIDPESGRALASGDRGMDVSPLGDVVCGRFYDNLPKGGAGQQAVDLLPTEVDLGDGRTLRFVAETVQVHDDAVAIAGVLEVG